MEKKKRVSRSAALKKFYRLSPGSEGQTSLQLIFPLLILLSAAISFAFLIQECSITQTLALAGGIIFLAVCLISTEAALYLLIFAMLLSPEFIVGATEGDSLGRGVTLRVDDFLLLIMGFSWLAKMAINKELGIFLKTPLNAPIAFYILVCLFSTLHGYLFIKVHLMTGFFFVLKYFEYIFVYFVAVNHIKTERQIQNFMWAMLIVCVIVSIIGLVQTPEGGRISAPFEGEIGEPNTFGGYLVFMISITTGLLLTTISFRAQLIYGIMASIFVICLLFTLSRSSYLALIPALLTFVWLSEKRKIVLTTLAIACILLPFIAPETVKERVAYTYSKERDRGLNISGVQVDTSTTARLMSWAVVSRDFIKHPFLGFGVTGYMFLDAQYFKVLIDTGLLGLFAFFFLLCRIFFQAYHIFKETKQPFRRGICMGFLAGFTGLLVHAIGANTFIIVRIMEPFWFVLAMVVMIPSLEPERIED